MRNSTCKVTHRGRDLLVTLQGDLDGRKAFGSIYDLMPPIDSIDRIEFNFSSVLHAKTEEISFLLAELAANFRFSDLQIAIQGLNWSAMDKRGTSLTAG